MNTAIARGVLQAWEAERPSGILQRGLRLTGVSLGERILSFLAQRPGSTTLEVQDAIRTGYSPTIQLGRLRASGLVRVEYIREHGFNNRTARWWKTDGR